ncbi:MAG: glycosyltransferase, partial [Hyphomicrobiales bacterium]|nr:glycosyltransferase [Hyphomicrobiales bacterium]
MRTVAAVVALVVCVHAGLWMLLQRQQAAASVDAPLASISYSPYTRSQHPDYGDRPTAEQIRADLKILSPYTQAIRTYTSTGGGELVPAIAAEFGLKVTLGIWIDKNEDRNEREIQAAVALARRHSNINAIVVGNETTFRAEKSIDELIRLVQRVKRQSPVPVTTGEIWTVWIEHPELASAVDFIAAHILPYWDGFTATQAVDKTIEFYTKLRQAHPGKRIVIAEFGWPSAGYNILKADPGRIEQASVLREFVSRAEAYGIDYNIVEAFDQPWKTNEGGVGMYWGMFDASRQAKFAWTGVVSDPDHWKVGAVAVLLGLLLSLPILARRAATFGEATTLAVAANMVGAWCATVFAFWQTHYFVLGAALALGLGILLLAPLVVIALARIEEIAVIAFGRSPRRLIDAALPAPDGFVPKVSIHVPAYREPPDMLKITLDAVARLDYPNFECVVVINNTPDPAFWRPIEDHCRALGERFKFVNEDNVAGYKAGALRLALAHTAADAEIIAVIDADYVVRPDWLKDLVPAFADPKVGMIQAPQDHRDGERTVMHYAMNGEYAGFFHIGMVQRNEANAIIVHGTMCLMRRAALISVGGWSSDTIVEDCDFGLLVLERGWQIHYTNRRYGHGLLPDTFEAYKKQRYRWAYGGFQILRKHWRYLMLREGGLTREQKR